MDWATPQPQCWLQQTAERSPSKQMGNSSLRCPEQTIRQETCTVEQIDGISVQRCEEVLERFRLCADGRKEMVESTTRTHIRPFGNEALCSSSGRYDDATATMGPVISSTLGQMLDDFFQYATELQQNLEQEGSGSSWRLPAAKAVGSSCGSNDYSSDSSSSSSSSGLFGWWLRRKGTSAGSGCSSSSSGGQPTLQQLVRQSSSSVQEI